MALPDRVSTSFWLGSKEETYEKGPDTLRGKQRCFASCKSSFSSVNCSHFSTNDDLCRRVIVGWVTTPSSEEKRLPP